MSKQPVPEHLLIFVRINLVADKWMPNKKEYWREYKFSHVKERFAAANHFWSSDKDEYEHAYAKIEQDKFYVILAYRVPGIGDTLNGKVIHRWLWRSAIEMTEKNIQLAYKFYQKNPTETRIVAKYIDQLNNPRLSEVLDEFEFNPKEAT